MIIWINIINYLLKLNTFRILNIIFANFNSADSLKIRKSVLYSYAMLLSEIALPEMMKKRKNVPKDEYSSVINEIY